MTRNRKGLGLGLLTLPMLSLASCLELGGLAGSALLLGGGCTATGGRTITLGFNQTLTVTDKVDPEAVGDTYSSGFSEGFLEMIVGWFDKPETEADGTG